ncbi:MAG: isopenicillin N synthase family dioxygenase [Janthinobacterium lividum]
MAEQFTVPVVDITPYVQGGTEAQRAATAAALDTACRTVGFIQIVGHAIPAGVVDGLTAAVDDFFALPLEAKGAYRSRANRGYTPPKSESLSLSLGVESATRMNDFFEAFNVGVPEQGENLWPVEAAHFRPGVEAWFAEAGRVARVLTRVFADALDLPPTFFDEFTDHSLDVLRMNNYALPAGTDVTLDGDLTGMGEHTDYGIVTVLWADQVRGLQVLDGDGDWHDVVPADGALLVNLGDLMARWTNERWMSTLHRVKPPVVAGTIERRRSAAFFHDGNRDAVIRAIPSCVAPGAEPLYPPITVGEHISAKLAGSRAGKVNATAEREAARVLAARN